MDAMAAPPRRKMAPPEIWEFLFYEAELLNEHKFEAWLTLFTPDCLYWMPAEEDQLDGESRISLYYDDRQIMEDRIYRLRHPKMYSQRPMARGIRLISNVVLEDGHPADAPVVLSSFTMAEFRLNEQRTLGGRYEHHLQRQDRDWKIAKKIVRLVNCDGVLKNVGVPV